MNKILTIFLLCCLVSGLHAQQGPAGLRVGDLAPDFKSKDQKKNTVHLKSLLKKGPVVLVFYRGEWCPYCNKHLKTFEDSLMLIKSKGASVIAITPETPEYISKTIEKTQASFPIIYDHGLSIMKSYDVSFKLDDKNIEVYKKYDLNFDVINGEVNGPNLPIPAVYVVDRKGKITYKYFEPNYKKRATIADILNHL
jgi:peroxiredoxin